MMRGLPLNALVRTVVMAASAVVLSPATTAHARAAPPSLAAEVKAAYLDKLGEFVQWPPAAFSGPDDPARLCIAGDDPFGVMLDQAVQGQRIGSHPIAVIRLDKIEKNTVCHVLFAAGSKSQSAAEVLDKVRGSPVLTVTDGAGGAARGIVNFVLVANRVRFQIDEPAAAQSGLMISSKLLSLALKPEG